MSVFGSGLLISTALSVIIPEGLHMVIEHDAMQQGGSHSHLPPCSQHLRRGEPSFTLLLIHKMSSPSGHHIKQLAPANYVIWVNRGHKLDGSTAFDP